MLLSIPPNNWYYRREPPFLAQEPLFKMCFPKDMDS
jgi:hypothetical protein